MAGRELTDNSKAGDHAPASAWLAGALGWLVPGGGHFLQGRWVRGLVLCAAVCGMFAMGLYFGGHLYPNLSGNEDGITTLLQMPPAFANLGSGVLYLFCWLTGRGFTENAKLVTFEYGNTFLWVAGLLNYLGMLDAFDIGAGRKP